MAPGIEDRDAAEEGLSPAFPSFSFPLLLVGDLVVVLASPSFSDLLLAGEEGDLVVDLAEVVGLMGPWVVALSSSVVSSTSVVACWPSTWIGECVEWC